VATIQEYFDKNQSKERQKIFLEGNKIGKVEGDALIIENYKQLQYIYVSDLPNLEKLTIKDCEELDTIEIYLDKKIDIKLIGSFLNLKEIKTNSTQSIIIQPPKKEGFCWGCVMHPTYFGAIIILLVFIFYLLRVIKELKSFVKSLQSR